MNEPLPHAPLLLRSRFRPTLSKRRRARPALVTLRRQSDNDKTRVSSINKRRVTPVPGDVISSRRGDEARRAGQSGNSARVPALDRVGLLDPPLRPFFRTDLGDSVARRSVPTGRFGLGWACLPCLEPPRNRAVRQRHDEPRTTPPNGPASQRNQRRHDAFHPSNPCDRLEKDFSLTRSIERGSRRATIGTHDDPASSDFSQETILPQARRTTTLFPADHASRHALARTRERPLCSCVWSVE